MDKKDRGVMYPGGGEKRKGEEKKGKERIRGFKRMPNL